MKKFEKKYILVKALFVNIFRNFPHEQFQIQILMLNDNI